MELKKKKVALLADETQMSSLLDWAEFNRDLLAEYEVYATGPAVHLLEELLNLHVIKYQAASPVTAGRNRRRRNGHPVDFLVFFWDPAKPFPDDPDITALLHSSLAANVPVAANRTAADFMFPSFLAAPE